MTKGDLAVENFKKGYNCSQAIVLAFKDEVELDEKTLLKLSSGFGGGLGRLRLTCGAFSAIGLIISLKYGYDTPETGDIKMNLYKRIQELGNEFKNENGSLICANLLGIKDENTSYIPTPRTEEFYKKRPCVNIIKSAGDILEEYIKNN